MRQVEVTKWTNMEIHVEMMDCRSMKHKSMEITDKMLVKKDRQTSYLIWEMWSFASKIWEGYNKCFNSGLRGISPKATHWAWSKSLTTLSLEAGLQRRQYHVLFSLSHMCFHHFGECHLCSVWDSAAMRLQRAYWHKKFMFLTVWTRWPIIIALNNSLEHEHTDFAMMIYFAALV